MDRDACDRIILSSSSRSITVADTVADEAELDCPNAPGAEDPMLDRLPPRVPVPRSGIAAEEEILNVPMLGICTICPYAVGIGAKKPKTEQSKAYGENQDR